MIQQKIRLNNHIHRVLNYNKRNYMHQFLPDALQPLLTLQQSRRFLVKPPAKLLLIIDCF